MSDITNKRIIEIRHRLAQCAEQIIHPRPDSVFSPAIDLIDDLLNQHHEIMQLLRDVQLPHGACQPPERKACTHCMARRRLDEIIKAYKGRPIKAL